LVIGDEYLIPILITPFGNFAGTKFLLFHFDGYHGFLTNFLLNFYYTGFFSQVYRAFFFNFMNRAIISTIFEKKSTRKAFIAI